MSNALAQPTEVPDAEEEAAQASDQIVVTGSRVARDSFSSAAPIQNLDAQSAKDIGVSSVNELLQRSTVVTGQQIDTTLNTASGNSNAAEEPPPGGVGSSNIGLRGLGPERTLILFNGKRLGASGVRGAPAQPDISLLPIGLVERVEVLTEGASAIYGADAVAGVINVILRNDFEGFELNASLEYPEAAGGETKRFSLVAGAQGDRTRLTFGAEYFEQNRVSLGSRIDCTRALAIDETTGETLTECSNGLFDNAVGVADGSLAIPTNDIFVFFNPAVTAMTSDIGINHFSSALQLPLSVEEDGACERADQRCRFNLIPFYSSEDEQLRSDLVQPVRRFSTVLLGGLDFEVSGFEQELFFEAYYFNRSTANRATGVQVFPTIPGQIPNVVGGVVTGMVDNPLSPFDDTDAAPILTLENVAQNRDVELQQIRFVSGMRGEFGSGWLQEKDWNWDVYFSYDRGTGFVAQPILFEPHLVLATLNVYMNPDGSLGCDIPNNTEQNGGFVTPPTCVPLNLFDEESFTGGNGDGVLSAEEAAYLVGNRTNRTAIEQYVVSGFVDGDLFDSPWGGAVQAGLGFEYRKDVIESQNSIVGVQGLNAAENPLLEGETFGSRHFVEFFGEVSVPLITDRPGIELLTSTAPYASRMSRTSAVTSPTVRGCSGSRLITCRSPAATARPSARRTFANNSSPIRAAASAAGSIRASRTTSHRRSRMSAATRRLRSSPISSTTASSPAFSSRTRT
ncbi:MAG: TonB-dependent receptor plug domain-containing protein [Rhodomicrobium sp.]|nr:TonB-dependent receptor plug domain-containing protein [Rhodomicrobium sp.]